MPTRRTACIAALLASASVSLTAIGQTSPTAAPPKCQSQAAPSETPASLAFNSDNYTEAASQYTAELAQEPTDQAYAGLVRSQIQLNQVEAALETATKAVTAFPHSAVAATVLGDAELRAGHIEVAVAKYIAARNLNFCDARAHFGLGRAFSLQSLHARARAEFDFAHKLLPTDAAIAEANAENLAPADRAAELKVLAMRPGISAATHKRLTESAWLLDKGATCSVENATSGPLTLGLYTIAEQGTDIRDSGMRMTINGKSASLELDSTADGIILKESDAGHFKIERPDSAPVGRKGSYGIVADLKIDKLRYHNCPVTILPDIEMGSGDSVIGLGFFRDSLIHIDWRTMSLMLKPYPASSAPTANRTVPDEEKDWSNVYIQGGKVLMPAGINRLPAGLVLLATGIDFSIISPRQAAASHLIPDHETLGFLHGTSGAVIRIYPDLGFNTDGQIHLLDDEGHPIPYHRLLKNVDLAFLRNDHPQIPADSFDISGISHAVGVEVAGLLSYTTLREFFIDIDYRNGLAKLTWDQMYSIPSKRF